MTRFSMRFAVAPLCVAAALATAAGPSASGAAQNAKAQENFNAAQEQAAAARAATGQMRGTTQAARQAARAAQGRPAAGVSGSFAGVNAATATLSPLAATLPASTAAMAAPGALPDYFGVGNYANSPLPQLNPLTGGVLAGTGMRKFVDAMPALPLAVPDTTTFPGSDYYEITLQQFNAVMHADLATANGGLGTLLRGYVQTNLGTNAATGLNTVEIGRAHV
jgi:hypothetical protein